MRGKRGVIGVGNQKAITSGVTFGTLPNQTPTGMVDNDSRVAQYESFSHFGLMAWANGYPDILTEASLTDASNVSMSSDGYHLYVGSYYSIAHWKLSIPYDIETRTFLYYWTCPYGGIESHIWSPDGTKLILGCWAEDRLITHYTTIPFYMKDPGDSYATSLCNKYNQGTNKYYAGIDGTGTGQGDYIKGFEFGKRIYYDENGDISSYGDMGTRVFLVDGGKDKVMWWDLTTAWDPTTMTNANNGWDYGTSNDTFMIDMYFSSDGTKLFLSGESTDDLFRYDLSTPWDLTGTVTLYGSWAVGQHEGFTFNKTGNSSTEGKYYFGGTSSGSVQMWTLDTPYDITGTTTLHSTSRDTGDGNHITGLAWDGEGKQLCITQEGSPDWMYIWRFSDAWDWDTYIDSYKFDLTDKTVEINEVEGCVWGGDDNMTLFLLDAYYHSNWRKGVYRCHFEVPGDGRTFASGSSHLHTSNDDFSSMQWSADGRKFFIQDKADDKIYEYKLVDWAPPYFVNLLSAEYVTDQSFSGHDPCGFCMTPDGKGLIWQDGYQDVIKMYKLTTPWTFADGVTQHSPGAKFANYGLDSWPTDLYMSNDGRIVLSVGRNNEELWEWRPHYD